MKLNKNVWESKKFRVHMFSLLAAFFITLFLIMQEEPLPSTIFLATDEKQGCLGRVYDGEQIVREEVLSSDTTLPNLGSFSTNIELQGKTKYYHYLENLTLPKNFRVEIVCLEPVSRKATVHKITEKTIREYAVPS